MSDLSTDIASLYLRPAGMKGRSSGAMPDIWMPARMAIMATTQRMQQRQMHGVLRAVERAEAGKKGRKRERGGEREPERRMGGWERDTLSHVHTHMQTTEVVFRV